MATDDCKHDETYVVCDGAQHTHVCSECGDDVEYEPCPEAGTFPSEGEDE